MKKYVLLFTGVIALATLSASLSSFSSSNHNKQQGAPIVVALSGAEEAPGPGDPDGSGTAVFLLNPGKGTIEYFLSVEDIEPATAAHIHIAPPGEPGPVVVPLAAPTNGSIHGVAEVNRDLILAILKNPSAYYVNVHNAAYPAGAVRGQLSR